MDNIEAWPRCLENPRAKIATAFFLMHNDDDADDDDDDDDDGDGDN